MADLALGATSSNVLIVGTLNAINSRIKPFRTHFEQHQKPSEPMMSSKITDFAAFESATAAAGPARLFEAVVVVPCAARQQLRRGLAAILGIDACPSMAIDSCCLLKQRLQAAEAKQETSATAWAASQQLVAIEAERRCRLERQLTDHEAVIGQLSRNRDSVLVNRLYSFQEGLKNSQSLCACAVTGLAHTRRQYETLMEGAQQAIAEIDESQDEPCTCCEGSTFAANALVAFKSARGKAAVCGQVAHWQARVLDGKLELQHFRAKLDKACHKMHRLDRCLDQARFMVVAVEEELEQERAPHLLTRQQLKQGQGQQPNAPCTVAITYRYFSSGSYGPPDDVAAKGSEEEHAADTIPACWAPCPEAAAEPQVLVATVPAKPEHRRNRSMQLS